MLLGLWKLGTFVDAETFVFANIVTPPSTLQAQLYDAILDALCEIGNTG